MKPRTTQSNFPNIQIANREILSERSSKESRHPAELFVDGIKYSNSSKSSNKDNKNTESNLGDEILDELEMILKKQSEEWIFAFVECGGMDILINSLGKKNP